MCCNRKCSKPANPAPSLKKICQSCTMPMGKPEDFGTNADTSKNTEYCCHCFQDGKFTEPDLTLEQMTENCSNMMKKMNVPEEKIKQTITFISMAKRWRK